MRRAVLVLPLLAVGCLPDLPPPTTPGTGVEARVHLEG